MSDSAMTRGYCTRCECNVPAQTSDHGIGRFEFQGYPCRDHDVRTTCSYCDRELEVERVDVEEA
ncbi:hypothetical protein [Burkholderia vietnamiensis]|uniref:hypothetical protein n=2 Tax=Burkholderia cepacia complex TaxID=87882 RepID=UPI001B9251A7|nr:hypothetical protein [Burkholderia vietnamiensis]MBR8147044.1 hypothetical protein [Burkholderia vietnamiensis]